jgi:hypothetical protein
MPPARLPQTQMRQRPGSRPVEQAIGRPNCKGSAEQILAGRVAGKIGMIIRRATQVVAETTMPRSATPWLPRAQPEGPRGAGIGQRRGCQDRAKILLGVCIPLRGRIFLRKTLLSPARCAPERSTRGPAKRGSGSGGDARDRARILLGRLQPATGSYLPLEETAQPFAVYSRRRLSCIPSRKAAVAPAKICSALPKRLLIRRVNSINVVPAEAGIQCIQ